MERVQNNIALQVLIEIFVVCTTEYLMWLMDKIRDAFEPHLVVLRDLIGYEHWRRSDPDGWQFIIQDKEFYKSITAFFNCRKDIADTVNSNVLGTYVHRHGSVV